ncbi:alpha/beta hydrolase [Algiphilus sp. W345]|uniref:Alpha/beta hydrolase n=1 Tax=Banduia mediterranea TaxID=3075609 RepID=A0ABU2WPD0_9GAMM|nr:alpha/beta hydrolase [Algiphilus sp. W345]MDT0499104.1 alpha/beta hydrolase [Algiphilus sp. W345]
MLIRWRERNLHLHAWSPPDPLGAVQIVHGMAEHGGRYAAFAQRLVAAGFAVYAHDLPGHGQCIADGDVRGHFADRHGWSFALASVEAVKDYVNRQHPSLPRFVFGHSMGSFLTQHLMLDHSRELAGVVLSATTGDLGRLRPLGLALLRAEIAAKGPRHPSAIGQRLGFGPFNRRFRPNRTAFDWLSRDADEVDRYIADPLCGFRVTASLWADTLGACGTLSSPRRLRPLDSRLPVLLISGSEDPVGNSGRGPARLARAYRKAGLQDVEVRSFAGARHELLHETNRHEVERLVLNWLGNRLRGR